MLQIFFLVVASAHLFKACRLNSYLLNWVFPLRVQVVLNSICLNASFFFITPNDITTSSQIVFKIYLNGDCNKHIGKVRQHILGESHSEGVALL